MSARARAPASRPSSDALTVATIKATDSIRGIYQVHKNLRPDGKEMTDLEWNSGFIRCFGMCLGGDAMAAEDTSGAAPNERVTLVRIP